LLALLGFWLSLLTFALATASSPEKRKKKGRKKEEKNCVK